MSKVKKIGQKKKKKNINYENETKNTRLRGNFPPFNPK